MRSKMDDTELEPGLKVSVLSKAQKVTITVRSEEVTFTPVKFNTFNVGGMTIEAELPTGVSIDEAISEMREVVRDYVKDAYKNSLESYLKALRYNDRRVRESKVDE